MKYVNLTQLEPYFSDTPKNSQNPHYSTLLIQFLIKGRPLLLSHSITYSLFDKTLESFSTVDRNYRDYASLIKLYQNKKLNKEFRKKTDFSSSFYKKLKPDNANLISKAIENFFKNTLKVKSEESFWTVFKSARKKVKPKGYLNSYVPLNVKATNEYRERYAIAYMTNVYVNPMIHRFFKENGEEIDHNLYALSEMLQFVFRSRLRNGEEIHLLIASSRMKELFTNWQDKMHKAYKIVQEQIEDVVSYQEKKMEMYLNTDKETLLKDPNFNFNTFEYELSKKEEERNKNLGLDNT